MIFIEHIQKNVASFGYALFIVLDLVNNTGIGFDALFIFRRFNAIVICLRMFGLFPFAISLISVVE